jgi:uncharacterized protein involved in exopolysaccharide biosynthesis
MSNLRALSIPGVRPRMGMQNPETFVAILQSRRLREKIIERFDLVNALRAKDVEACLRTLEKRIAVEIANTGVIQVTVVDTDKARAADIANAMIEELDRINVELRIYKSRRARQYLEEQLAVARVRLAAVEDSLQRFQVDNLAVAIPEQSRAAVDAIAALEAKAIELRIRKGFMQSYATGENPDLQGIERELSQVQGQIRALEFGSGDEMSFSRLPLLGMRYGRLLRDVKTGELLIGLLTEDYEQARLDEAKETPVVQVLDSAVPAVRKFRPKRSLIVACATLAAFLLVAAVHVAVERYRALADSADRSRWSAVVGRFFGWLPRPLRR